MLQLLINCYLGSLCAAQSVVLRLRKPKCLFDDQYTISLDLFDYFSHLHLLDFEIQNLASLVYMHVYVYLDDLKYPLVYKNSYTVVYIQP